MRRPAWLMYSIALVYSIHALSSTVVLWLILRQIPNSSTAQLMAFPTLPTLSKLGVPAIRAAVHGLAAT